MSGENLIYETKMYNLSTRSSSCNILNEDVNYKSLCEYNIPNMIERDETIEYIQFSIPDAVIPVSFYTVNENNCQLDVIEYDGAGGSLAYTVVFPYGNYNASYFINEFKALLNASGSNTNSLSNFNTRWNITLNGFNSVFTITNANQFTIFGTSTISSVMGFSNNVDSNFVSVLSYVATLPRCCNFLALPRITLRCEELANTTTIGNQQTSDVIITIPNNARPNGQIYYQNQSNAKLLFRRHEVCRFVVSITDDDGNLLNFNGISSFFTFQFDIFRKYMPKPPRFSNIIEYVNHHTSFLYPDEEQPLESNV